MNKEIEESIKELEGTYVKLFVHASIQEPQDIYLNKYVLDLGQQLQRLGLGIGYIQKLKDIRMLEVMPTELLEKI